MGIFGAIVKGTVKTVATPVVTDALDVSKKTIDKACEALDNSIEKKAEKQREIMLHGNPDANRMFISRRKRYKKYKYTVRDRSEKVKYIVKVKKDHSLYFYDSSKKKLGTIKEKRTILKNPFSNKPDEMNFKVEIKGKKWGLIKSKWAFTKTIFETDFNSLGIEGNLSGRAFKVYKGEKCIAEALSKFRTEDTYAIDLLSTEDELEVLMLGLVVDMVSTEI